MKLNTQKSTILLIGTFLMFTLSYGQINLKGTVKEVKGSPLAFSTIKVFSADSAVVGGGITDSLGEFSIDLSLKEGSLKFGYNVSLFGYISYFEWVDLQSGTSTYIFDNIRLKEELLEVGDVEIFGKKKIIEKKIDRLVFNVDGLSTAQGNTMLELLSKTPLVMVNNDVISIIGKGSSNVMLNERMIYLSGTDLINYLSSIPAEDILKIEVITNPPSKYDASGGGLINIVTKKNYKSGTSGNFSSSYIQAYYPTGRIGLNINNRSKKINFYNSLNLRLGQNYNPEEFTYKTNDIITFLDARRTILQRKSVSFITGFDYEIRKNHTLSVTADLLKSERQSSLKGFGEYFHNTLRDSILNINTGISDNTFLAATNANYVIQMDSSRKSIEFNFNYVKNINSLNDSYASQIIDNEYTALSNNSLKQGIDQNINILSFATDYYNTNDKLNWSAGAKINWILNHTNNSLERQMESLVQDDDDQNGSYDYKEYTQAAYLNVNKSFKKFEFEVGMRLENTILEANVETKEGATVLPPRKFLNLFPTAYALYSINDNCQLSFSYGNRINRPGYYDMNPYRRYDNPNVFHEGNVYLRPTFQNDMQLDVTLAGRYYFGLIYTQFVNSNMSLPIQLSANEFKYVQDNVGNTGQYGTILSVPIELGETFQMNVVVIYLYSVFNSKRPDFPSSTVNLLFSNVNGSMSFGQKKKLSANVGAAMRPLGSIYTVIEMSPQYIVSCGLKYKFNNQAYIAANVNDIFAQQTPRSVSSGIGYSVETINFYDSRSFSLSFNYSFGNNFLKNRKNRDTKIEDENNRIN